jgi:hypothetical protein
MAVTVTDFDRRLKELYNKDIFIKLEEDINPYESPQLRVTRKLKEIEITKNLIRYGQL